MARSPARSPRTDTLPRRRAIGSLMLTALPAVVLGIAGLGYLRYEVAIAEREVNEAARSFAAFLASRLNDGLETFRESPEIRLRTLPAQDFFKTEPPEPRSLKADDEAFEIYESALDSGEHAREMLESEVASFDQRFTPAGLPLKPLAEYQLARLASEAGDGDALIGWLGRMLESAVETHPSTISATLIERGAALAESHQCGEAVRISHWRARWLQSNRTREMLRRNWDALRANINVSRWFRAKGGDYFWGLRESDGSVVYSKVELEDLAGELVAGAIGQGGRSRYPLAVRITFEKEEIRPTPLNDPAERKAWMERLGYNPIPTSRSGPELANAGGGLFGVRVFSADPEGFRSAVRRQTLKRGVFLGAVILCLGAGVWLTWRAMETQRKLNELQSDFISSVSHELRAPVAGIRLLSERLASGKSDPGKRDEYVHLIEREAGRLGTLVANVLDVTRIGQGRKTYDFEPANIAALVRDTVDRMGPLADERGIAITAAIEPPKVDPAIDAVAIQQALGNLIDNAIKFSPGGGKIAVKLRPEIAGEQESGFLISVSDEGPGVPADEQDRIFERFYRVGSELQRETPGAGIGLSLVRHIAEAHGGTVSVESEPGKGSRFVLRIPT